MSKSPEMEHALDRLSNALFGYGRIEGKCAACGKDVDVAEDFVDEISIREYGISRMCQECQDGVFGRDGI